MKECTMEFAGYDKESGMSYFFLYDPKGVPIFNGTSDECVAWAGINGYKIT